MRLAWPLQPSRPDAERRLNQAIAELRADIERLRRLLDEVRREAGGLGGFAEAVGDSVGVGEWIG